VEDFTSVGEVVTHRLADSPVGASAQGLGFDKLDCLMAKVSLNLFVPLLSAAETDVSNYF